MEEVRVMEGQDPSTSVGVTEGKRRDPSVGVGVTDREEVQ